MVAGCGLVDPTVLRITMKVGTSVLIAAGQEYVKPLLDGSDPGTSPTVTISYADEAQNPAIEVYFIEGASTIAASGVNGTVEI